MIRKCFEAKDALVLLKKPANEIYSLSFKTSAVCLVGHHAEVTSKRTNLSPFTKDYRGAAS